MALTGYVPAIEGGGRLKMFKGIEGARAWLAWAVVASHIVLFNGLETVFRKASILVDAGRISVMVFIIISGFVITHLVVSKREPFRIYIARRFLRIYPPYLICLLLGVAVAPLAVPTMVAYSRTTAEQLPHLVMQANEYAANFWPHMIAHLTLMHGAISNGTLPQSQYMFLAPAWSLSLEWQFYLIAPFLIAGLTSPRFRLAIVAVTGFAAVAYAHGKFGQFYSRSVLPGAGLYFLVGIATRLCADRLPRLERYPFALALGALAFGAVDRDILPVALWVVLVAYFCQPKRSAFLDGRLAHAAGARSYSVYLVHEPLLKLSLWLAVGVLNLSFWMTVAFTGLVTVAGTLAASEILYRLVESPAIKLGRSLAAPKGAPADERSIA